MRSFSRMKGCNVIIRILAGFNFRQDWQGRDREESPVFIHHRERAWHSARDGTSRCGDRMGCRSEILWQEHGWNCHKFLGKHRVNSFCRIVLNIVISNTDDHLRNHGFLLMPQGWRLSPAYDVNPNPNGGGLSLNISMDDNSLDFELALSVAAQFHVKISHAQDTVKKLKELSVIGKIPRWNWKYPAERSRAWHRLFLNDKK